jgi:AraC family transcriptional regulator
LNRITILHETPDLAVRLFDHPRHEAHEDPDREVGGGWTINFVESGSFDVIVDGARQRLREGSVLLMRPGLEFCCDHAERFPNDVCLSVAFEPHAACEDEAAWARTRWVARETGTPRLAYVHARLGAAAATGNAFELERWGLGALTALRADGAGHNTRGPYAARGADVDAVIAVCRDVEADCVARTSIADRARRVGMTSTRLTHCFRRYLQMSPHQYVVRWRLAAATNLLDAGASVSEGCYRSGFENLSHFCRSFRRAFGVRASEWRSLPLRERRRKVQDLTTRAA